MTDTKKEQKKQKKQKVARTSEGVLCFEADEHEKKEG